MPISKRVSSGFSESSRNRAPDKQTRDSEKRTPVALQVCPILRRLPSRALVAFERGDVSALEEVKELAGTPVHERQLLLSLTAVRGVFGGGTRWSLVTRLRAIQEAFSR